SPPTVTTTEPVVAPAGTGAVMLVSLQAVAVAAVPLNVTVLAPCVAPKWVPPMVAACPMTPAEGVSDAILGSRTVNVAPLLALPPTVTTTGPVVAPLGTDVAMLVLLQLVAVAVAPLKVMVLDP